MARFVLFTFLVLCMVYMIQANPRPDHSGPETTTQDPFAQGAAALENLAAKAKKSFEEAAKNPDFQNIIASGKKLFEEGLQNFHKTVAEFMPKTDHPAPSA